MNIQCFFHSAFASIYLPTYLGNRGNLGVLTMLNISSEHVLYSTHYPSTVGYSMVCSAIIPLNNVIMC